MTLMSPRSWDDWIREYAQSHQHPKNRLCHTIGIPLIALSIVYVAVENGTFRLKGTTSVDPGQLGLFEEMTTFPCGEHDDLLDAAATGAAYLLEKREPRVWTP